MLYFVYVLEKKQIQEGEGEKNSKQLIVYIKN